MHQVQVFEPTCVFSQVPHENARGFFGMLGPGTNLAHYQNVTLASTNLNFPDVMAHDEFEALGVAVQTTLGFRHNVHATFQRDLEVMTHARNGHALIQVVGVYTNADQVRSSGFPNLEQCR